MQYRDFGNLGIKMSALGFGAMRLPKLEDGTIDLEQSVPMLRHALDLGVNYIDSAWGYINGTSEIGVGLAIKDRPRDSVYIATKVPVEDVDARTWRECLDESFKRLDTDYIDFLHFHGLNWAKYEQQVLGAHILEEALRAQQEGLFRHLSFSFHDNVENLIKLVDTGHFASVTLQYNLLDRANDKGISHARARGMGVVVMGPVGGGRLGFPSDAIRKLMPGGVKSTPELAFRFVLAHPGVTVALSGMNTMPMIDENVATTSNEAPLSVDELASIQAMLDENKRLADLYCTGCGYCMPCPNQVDIPENLRFMNYHRVWELTDYAKQEYGKLGVHEKKVERKKASACIACGECEPKCPQHIPIIDRLAETAEALG